jgi:hypothetical protein
MNRELQAQAFTHGQDVYFGAGKFDPGSDSGKRLLAHELTHTIQQTGNQGANRASAKAKSAIAPKQAVKFANGSRKDEEKLPVPTSEAATSEIPELAESSLPEMSGPENQELAPTSEQNQESQPEQSTAQETDQKTAKKRSIDAKPKNLKDSNQAASQSESDTALEETLPQGLTSQTEPTVESPETAEPGQSVPQSAPEALNQSSPPESEQQSLTPPQSAEDAGPAPQVAPAPQAPQASGGGTPAAPAGGTEVAPSGDEESAAASMQQRLAEVAPKKKAEKTDRLSPAQRQVAHSVLTADPLPATQANGGEAGAAIEAQPDPPAPDVSQAEPTAALGALSGLAPKTLATALGGVTTAVGKNVGQEREALAANPPQMNTATAAATPGSEQAQPTKQEPQAPEKQGEGEEKPTPDPEPLPPVAKPQVVAPAPAVQGDEEGKLSDADVANMQSSLSQLPTHDAGGTPPSAGASPTVVLEGNADPQQAQTQKAALEQSLAQTHAKGQQELAQPLGENQIYPTLPAQTLSAQISAGGQGQGDTGNALAAAGMGDAVSILAQEEQGDAIQGAIAQAQAQMAAEKATHATTVAQEQAANEQEIALLRQENAQEQSQERQTAQDEVGQMRDDWSQEQADLVTEYQTEADQEVSQGLTEIETKQVEGNTEASKEVDKGEVEAEQERQKGEEEAAKEKAKGEKESGGLLGWLADRAKSFFEGIKKAVQAAFERAREAVRKAIDKAKQLAAAAIERARKAIVATIRRVGDALIAIGDKLLAAFPEMREKWRNTIKARVQQAEAKVNELAQKLNDNIQKALDVYGQALDAALGLLEKGLLAAVGVVESTVNGAIEFAQSALEALGAFAQLIPKIAANPGQWIGNMVSGMKAGVTVHLWGAVKEAISGWFGGKVQEVTSLTPSQTDQLQEDGFSLGAIAKMVWNNIVGAIPGILIGILMEKLIAMLIPVLGGLMVIIESLQAAWGVASKVLAAFSLFMGFLQAVHTGQSGPLFAGLIGAAVVIVVDFVAEWLIDKLKVVAKAIAGKLKGMLKRDKKKPKDNKDLDKDNKDLDKEGEAEVGDTEELNQQGLVDRDKDRDGESDEDGEEPGKKKAVIEESDDPNEQKRSNAEVERDTVAEEKTEDGHTIKVTDTGDCYKCSECKKIPSDSGDLQGSDTTDPQQLAKQIKENKDNEKAKEGNDLLEDSSEDKVTRPDDSPFYEVGYEAQLEEGKHYPGHSDRTHFQEANRQLYEAMQSDPDFAKQMEEIYPGLTEAIQPGARGAYPRRSPTSADLTWHHDAYRAGSMQLIPRDQHTSPGAVQESLHPNRKGGMEIWGGGRRKSGKKTDETGG